MPRRRKTFLQFETEASWFLLCGVLDIVLTYLLLRSSALGTSRTRIIEGNPIARWILVHAGFQGLLAFKILMMVVVVAIAEVVGRTRPRVGRGLLLGGTCVVAGVVVYSVWLYRLNH